MSAWSIRAAVLLDDRPGVELGGHVVAGRPDQLHPALEGLVVGAGPGERGQEAVVDVDDASGVAVAQLGRDDLHVPGQHHHAPPGPPSKMRGHLGERLGLPAGVERRRAGSRCRATRPGRGGPDGWRSTSGMSQSSSPLRHRWSRSTRQWSSLLTSTTTRLPLDRCRCRCQSSSSSVGQSGETPGELLGAEGQAVGQHLDALEEAAGVEVAVLGRLDHPPAVGGDEAGDGSHDARPVGTGDGQDQSAHRSILTRLGGPGRTVARQGEPTVSGRTGGDSPRVHCDVTVLLNGSCTNWISRPVHPLPFRPARGGRAAADAQTHRRCALLVVEHDS